MKSKNTKKNREVFYLSTDDRENLSLRSEELQVSKSYYIRYCLLKEMKKQVILPEKRNISVDQYRNQLLRIGVNLNMISRKLNSGKKFILVDQQTLLDEMNSLHDHIKEIQSKI